ncbi:hypothetical protein KY346_02495 [Candidatus Woesearchaeota archaeon]|nr:hypothetical protein [Candidatus Woesearchaeota archaeon]
MFKLFKKKKEAEEVELPPPPMPPEAVAEKPKELELPEIKPAFPEIPSEEEMPEFPEITEEEEFEHVEIPSLPEHPTMAEHEIKMPEIRPRRVFEETIKEEVVEPEEIIRPEKAKPMFVAVDEYNNLMSNANFVRSKLIEAEEYLQRLTDLKNQELKAFDKWRKTLENVESKLSYVDKIIAKAQG